MLEVAVRVQHDRERQARGDGRLDDGGVLNGLRKQLETSYPEHRPRREAKPDLFFQFPWGIFARSQQYCSIVVL